MRSIALTLALLTWPLFAWSQQPPVINFNLVQVNHYHGQESAVDSVITPGERVVIDLGSPLATQRFLAGSSANVGIAPVMVNIESMIADDPGGVSIPWESRAVLRTVSGRDSFLVSSSRSGCPGTEVRPSVAVAFPTARGWSDPPIRFGPLSEQGLCALGRGVHLQVSVSGDGPPVVKLREESALFGKR
jgi:hypothetical protein